MRWDAERYDSSFGFVTAHGASLLDALDPRPGERVLDLGCGTGELTAAIAERGAWVIGVDSSPEMVTWARASFPDLRFEVADGHDFTCDALDIRPGLDAVFSNAALHWMSRDPSAVQSRVRDALRPEGGRLVAEFGGAANITRIAEVVRTAVRETGREPAPLPWYFPTPGDYVSLLEAAGLTVRHLDYFDRPTPLDDCPDGIADWVRMFGDGLLAGIPTAERPVLLARVRELAAGDPILFRDGRWHADYVRLRVIATLNGPRPSSRH